MSDLQKIRGLIDRTRRRLRLQAALEWATTTSVLAVAGALIVLWFWRMEILGDQAARFLTIGLGSSLFVAALAGSLRRHPLHVIASRIDRASGLSDRLGTACEFADRLAKDGGKDEHPDTLAMMHAAIADGVKAVPRANVEAAAPFRAPRDLRGAAAFTIVATAVVCLAFHREEDPRWRLALIDRTHSTAGTAPAKAEDEGLEKDDLQTSKQFLKDMKELAEQTGDPELIQFANELEALLEKAEKGEITKEELLAQMEKLEQKYMEGADLNVDETLADLKEQGKELKKEPLTRRLGEALEAGDMDAAQKEWERLAEQVEKQEFTPEQEKKLAAALEKSAKKHDDRKKQEDDKLDQEIAKKKDEVEKLRKKHKDDPKNEQTKRQLQKKERELEKLERDREEKKEQAKKRRLERLNRDMKKSAENLNNGNRKEASKDLKEAGKDSEGVEDEIRKSENKKKVASQMGDIRDSVRRARQKKGQGSKVGQARADRMKEWEKRAGGGKGDWKVWKPGQDGNKLGQGKPGQKPGQQPGQGGPGQQPGNQNGGQGEKSDQESNNYGDGHDENLMGDPSRLAGKKKDEQLSGKHGKGPSRRETILTSSKKGFASTAYTQVYAEYKKIIEEVMNKEKVPQGYKYYVKRYFQRIKPHSMD